MVTVDVCNSLNYVYLIVIKSKLSRQKVRDKNKYRSTFYDDVAMHRAAVLMGEDDDGPTTSDDELPSWN
jgi:hypothetical protein